MVVAFHLVWFFTVCSSGKSSSPNCRGEQRCGAKLAAGLLHFVLKVQACHDSRDEPGPVSDADGGESVFSVA